MSSAPIMVDTDGQTLELWFILLTCKVTIATGVGSSWSVADPFARLADAGGLRRVCVSQRRRQPASSATWNTPSDPPQRFSQRRPA